ncbi:MAG: endo-1,4-beta-xylanase [Clostridia bacterium]|nr:endo-1,4-beta-xylanase [Clostridia bacterium]
MPLPKPWKLPPIKILDEAQAKVLLERVRDSVDLKINALDKMVDENIKKNRMSTVRLEIYDKEGNEITDAKVDVELKNHEFKFGCNAFLADDLGSDERNAEYERVFRELFNQAVVPFYWKDDEPEPGKWRFEKDSPYIYRRPPAEQMLDFCKRTNCEPKGHNLVWSSNEHGVPKWLSDDKAVNGRLIDKRIRLLAERYADKIPVWDVLNEFIGANQWNYRFPDDIDVRAFKLAEELFPDDHLIINEFQCLYHPNFYLGKKSAFYLQIEKLLVAGCKVDGIGMQLHMFHNEDMLATDEPLKYTAEHLIEMVDTYSTLGKDIHFSEITFPSYDGRETYLELQNVITENLYKLWFSMEKVKSIVWWNLVDGTAVKKANADAAFDENYFGGGLLKNDFTKKPAFETLENLIKNEWHTKETVVTNNKGYASFTGFNGEYDIVINKGKDSVKRTIKVSKDNPIIVIQLD